MIQKDTAMSVTAKFFLFILVLSALGSLAHDIYVWQNANGFPFAFAALGWIAKTYCPDELQLVIDTLTPETFNTVLTPVLKIPAFFMTTGLAIFVFVVDFINRTVKNMTPGRGKDRDQQLKYKRK